MAPASYYDSAEQFEDENYSDTTVYDVISGDNSTMDQTMRLHKDPLGAAVFIVIVTCVYALPIVLFLVVLIFHRSSSRHAEKRDMDRQVEKFIEHTIRLQDSWSRDNFKRLKRTLIPVVANSPAKELIVRRPSCIALMHASNISINRRLSTDEETEPHHENDSASGVDTPIKCRRPDDGYHIEARNLQTRDLKVVNKMNKIIEEDDTLEWAAQFSKGNNVTTKSSSSMCDSMEMQSRQQHHHGELSPDLREGDTNHRDQAPSTSSSLNYLAENEGRLDSNKTASQSTQDDDEYRIWIPLPNTKTSSFHPSSRFDDNPQASGIVNYWKSLVNDKPQQHSNGIRPGRKRKVSVINNCYLIDSMTDYGDLWPDEDCTIPLLPMKSNDNANKLDKRGHMLYISEVSSCDSQSITNDRNCAADNASLQVDDETDSELASLTWSDTDDSDHADAHREYAELLI